MIDGIINEISKELNISEKRIKAALKLLEDGNTIPFIARYRKEATGSLDEEELRSINEYYAYEVNLLKRKNDVIRLIDEKGLLTEQLKKDILDCTKLVDVEDLYRPFKEKKKTKATEAINNGLEPLARLILAHKENIDNEARRFVNEKVKTVDDAITGALYIIAEEISDKAKYRKYIRDYTFKTGTISTKKKKNDLDQEQVYSMYYDYHEELRKIKPHRILAINRGEKEDVINVSIDFNKDNAVNYIKRDYKLSNDRCSTLIILAINDSLKRLIFPCVEREIRALLSEKSEEVAISNFRESITPATNEK